MDDVVSIHFGYQEGHPSVDWNFYAKLPNRDIVAATRQNPDGSIQPANPDPVTLGTVIISGTAAASVAALATLLKTWIESKRTRIIIQNAQTGMKIEYEGPSLDKNELDIEGEIRSIAKGSDSLKITAVKRVLSRLLR